MTYYRFRYLCVTENRYFTFDADYEYCAIPSRCPNAHTDLSTLTKILTYAAPSWSRGNTKKFPGNLASAGKVEVIPATGYKLAVVRLGAYRGSNTEDAPVVFQIEAGGAIVSQSYFKNLAQLKARANRVQMIGNDTHMDYVFPEPSSPDANPIELAASVAAKLKIQLTNDAEHAPSDPLTAYAERSALGKADPASAVLADAPLWIETLSYPE